MKQWAKTNKGFTIVELLIVVVVIAILAAITIVAYNGIRQRSEASALASSLKQATQKVQVYKTTNNDQYPPSLDAAGVKDQGNMTYQYTFDNSGANPSFTLTATANREKSLYVASSDGTQREGIAPGHNTIFWYEAVDGSPLPLSGGSVDTSVFRNGDRSMRVGPSSPGVGVRGSTFDVIPGQVFTLSFWLQTDSNWNGLGNNSKVRFGDQATGGAIQVCAYNGPKVTWTYITCSYTVGSNVSRMTLSVGNDGTTGNIWLDDISLSIR